MSLFRCGGIINTTVLDKEGALLMLRRTSTALGKSSVSLLDFILNSDSSA